MKSVTIDPPLKEDEEWTNPLQPFTHKKHEQMITEAEEGPSILAEKAE